MTGDVLTRFGRRLRWGMVGGGSDSLIGETHRYAARIDNCYDLVAGCLSIDPDLAASSARASLIKDERAYSGPAAMATEEAARDDGIEVVTICTPPHLHGQIAAAFLAQGIHVICEKPLTKNLAQARDLLADVAAATPRFMLTHCYSGYPMVREATALVASGALGTIRQVEVDFVNGPFQVEEPERARRHWRFLPEFMSPASILGEIGTHAHHMACSVSGLQVTEVSADMTIFTPGRETFDDAQMLLRFNNGARGRMWCSFVATGDEHGLAFRVYGTRASVQWQQERPERMWLRPVDGPPRLLTAGREWLTESGRRAGRLREGHGEGYVFAFATLYRDFAYTLMSESLGLTPDRLLSFPTVEEGAATMAFYEAAEASQGAGGAWQALQQI